MIIKESGLRRLTQAKDKSLKSVCPLNCKCCLRYQQRDPCFCHAEKRESFTQTDGFDYMRMHSNTKDYFTRGAFSHSVMQKRILKAIDSYQLDSKKHPQFQRAVMDVLTSFPDLDYNTDIHVKIANRMSKAISWQRFSEKKRKSLPDNAPDVDPVQHEPEPEPAPEPAPGPIPEPTPVDVVETQSGPVQASTDELDSSDDEILLSAVKDRAKTKNKDRLD